MAPILVVNARRPSNYALTWLPRCDGAPPGNQWAAIKTKNEAQAIVAAVHGKRKAQKQGCSLAKALPLGALREHPPPKIYKVVV